MMGTTATEAVGSTAVADSAQGQAGRYSGRSITRVEDARLIRGQGQYVDDVTLSNVAYAEIVRSPVPHAIIRSIDTSAARALPGVLGVYTGHDVVLELHALLPVIEAGVPNRRQTPPQYPIAMDEAVYEGEPLAIVVAETRYLAADAAELVIVDYETLPAVSDLDAAVAEGAPTAHRDAPDNVGWDISYPAPGDIDAAFAGAAAVMANRLAPSVRKILRFDMPSQRGFPAIPLIGRLKKGRFDIPGS